MKAVFFAFVVLFAGVAMGSADPNAANKIDYLPGIDPQPSYDMYRSDFFFFFFFFFVPCRFLSFSLSFFPFFSFSFFLSFYYYYYFSYYYCFIFFIAVGTSRLTMDGSSSTG